MKLKQRALLCMCIICTLIPYLWLSSLYQKQGHPVISDRRSQILEGSMNFNRIDRVNDASSSLKRNRRTKESNYHKSKTYLKNNDSAEGYSKNIKDNIEPADYESRDPWQIWSDMVKRRQVTPNEDRKGDDVGMILEALSYKPIIGASIGHRGTQLKATLILEGKQKVVFKPKRYSRGHIIQGKPYDGFDRHNGEIAAFHLDRILGFYRAPPVAGRTINLADEIEPIGDKRLLDTFFYQDGNTCFYGVCHYCKKSEAACANGTDMEGSVTIWLPTGWSLTTTRHPWQRTYREGRKAYWEIDNNYCQKVIEKPPYDAGPRLLDIMDTAVFDFLIGNADRHHYETFKKGGDDGMLIHLDNAKSFGNPHHDELSILAPVYQCCRIRLSTWLRLVKIKKDRVHTLSDRLRKSMDLDPVSPILTKPHLRSLDRRLGKALDVIRKCISKNGKRKVLIKDND